MFKKLFSKATGSVQKLNGNQDLLEAICAGCVLVGSASGGFSDAEAMTTLESLKSHETISVAFTTTQIEAAFNKQADRAKRGMAGGLALKKEIQEARSKSSTDDLEMALMICIDVAMSGEGDDANIDEAEMKKLREIAQSFGLTLSTYLS